MSFSLFTVYALPFGFVLIDDIFFIWDNDEISLQSFLKFCNSCSTNKKMKSTINFTFSYSKQEAIFFDTKVSFQHNILASQLYSKPTSAHQYLQRNSFHPPSLLKSIPKSQFIRIRRICTPPPPPLSLTIGFMLLNLLITFLLEDSTELTAATSQLCNNT